MCVCFNLPLHPHTLKLIVMTAQYRGKGILRRMWLKETISEARNYWKDHFLREMMGVKLQLSLHFVLVFFPIKYNLL